MERQSIIEQLKVDEGFRAKAFWDNKQFTYGYGTRAPRSDATITEAEAAELLGHRVDEAVADFNRIFKDHLKKFNEVRAEAFVNLIFNMGPGRPDGSEGLLSFKNTLGLIFNKKEVPWIDVSENLKKSLWFRQVGTSGAPPGRGNRLVKEIALGVKA
jgi:hypothetical protein